jgi:hypothetical protein
MMVEYDFTRPLVKLQVPEEEYREAMAVLLVLRLNAAASDDQDLLAKLDSIAETFDRRRDPLDTFRIPRLADE